MINQVTIFTATSGDSNWVVDDMDSIGGIYNVPGEGARIGHLTAHAVEEYQRANVKGLCLNVHDLGGQGDRPFAQAIPAVTAQYGRGDFRAEQRAVVTGASPQEGLDSSGDGYHVRHDSQYNISARIPIYHKEGLKQLGDNIEYARHALASAGSAQAAAGSELKAADSPADVSAAVQEEQTAAKHKTEIPAHKPTVLARSSQDNKKDGAILKAKHAVVDEIAHEPLTVIPTAEFMPTGLARYGMWGERAVQDMQARAGRAAHERSAGGQPIGFIGGLAEHVSEAYHSPLYLSAAFLDRSSSLAQESSVHYREVEERFRGDRDISRTPTSGFAHWEKDVDRGLDHKIIIRSTASILERMGGLVIEGAKAVDEIGEAKPGEKGKAAVLAGAELVGVVGGSWGCEVAVGGALVLAGITDGAASLLVPTAACGAGVGYTARSAAEHGLETHDQESHSSLPSKLRKE